MDDVGGPLIGLPYRCLRCPPYRVSVFNDPNCSSMAGEYSWRLERGTLTFQVIDDPCAFGNERANDLMVSEWTDVPACHRRMIGLWPGFLGCGGGST
jgi:hypothetical protein